MKKSHKKQKRNLLLFVICYIFCALLLGCAKDKGLKEYKLSVNVSQETAWGKGAARFAELVLEKSDGKIRIKPYYNMTLAAGDQIREICLLQSGAIDFSLNSTINYTPTIKELNVFSLPFLFSSPQEVDNALAKDAGRRVGDILQRHDLIVLGWGENGFRELTNRLRPISHPEDIKGMKIRVCSPIYVDIFRSIGANPTAMVWAEALTAFRKGVVDGEENPVVGVILPYDIAEYHKYLTLWHYSYDALILSCGKNLWNSFTPGQQALLKQCANEAMEYQKDIARSGLKEALEYLQKEKGVTVTELTAEQREAFRSKTRAVYEKYSQQIGHELVKAFEDAIQSE